MTQTTLDLQRYIPALLSITSSKLSHGASAKYRGLFGIGITEWRVLANVAIEPDISAARISEKIGLDKALVSRTVQKLTAQRLLLAQVDQRNTSRHRIRLTRAGEVLHDRVLRVVRQREKILHAAFTPEEIEVLISLLHRLNEQADVVNAYEPTLEQDAAPARPAKRKARR
jgi:DNA-binding MarR family transcriptional regulator